jgi:hypothetical protein
MRDDLASCHERRGANYPFASFRHSRRTTGFLKLHGRAFHIPKGTEHAAVTRQWPKQPVTAFALVKEDARIGGHFFGGGGPTFRAGDDGVQRDRHGHAISY